MKKFAFTLAEIVIVIACVGVLATIMLGSLDGLQPDKEKVMFKKAYQNTERVVGELVNDESIYPYDPDAFGFYNKNEAFLEGTNISFQGDMKFCCFFARKLNVYADPAVCEAGATVDEPKCVFQTTDGISWIVESDFDKDTKSSVLITVDVNGSQEHNGKGPNSSSDDVQNRDIFNIIVDFDGRVRVTGDTEKAFLSSHTPNRR